MHPAHVLVAGNGKFVYVSLIFLLNSTATIFQRQTPARQSRIFPSKLAILTVRNNSATPLVHAAPIVSCTTPVVFQGMTIESRHLYQPFTLSSFSRSLGVIKDKGK